jgi:DNA-binding transcriptional MerR regulator
MVNLPTMGRSSDTVVVFTIGAFSALTGVSAKRLRHYDGAGLFQPVWVDPATRYRYYSATQIPDLRRIVSLVNLGIPLQRIKNLRTDGRSLSSELERRRFELEKERLALEHRLAELEIRLERSGDLDVVVRRRPPGRWASLSAEVATGTDLAPLFVEIEAQVQRRDARAAEPPVCIVHGVNGNNRSIELLIPIDRAVPATERIKVVTTPAAAVASSLVVGTYDNLTKVTANLKAWAKRTGRRVTGPPWYVYLRFGAEEELQLPAQYLTDDESEVVTEVLVEVQPAGQGTPLLGRHGLKPDVIQDKLDV